MRTLACLFLLTTLVVARPTPRGWPPATYSIYYGAWSDTLIEQAWEFDLVVLHPGANFDNLTRAQADRLRQGRDGKAGTDDDVIALGYVSLGEDEEVPAGPPRPGPVESGPVHRALDGQLVGDRGGYPTRYLDELSFIPEKGFIKLGSDGKPVTRKGQDGLPDENGVWGSYYVNPGDPGWKKQVLERTQRIEAQLGLDGFFWDTLDTASPWGNYGFTQAAMAGLLQELRIAHPDRLIMGNRGMFLLDTHPESFKSSLDGLLFESFLTEWDWLRKTGVQSPWLKGNADLLRNQLVAASQDRFALFFVDYLNPKQSDFYQLLHADADLLAGIRNTNYVSDPLLQVLYPPYPRIFPLQGSPMASLSALRAEDLGRGRFALSWELTNPGQLAWGEALFLDVRYSASPVEPRDIVTLPALPVSYPLSRFESYGLDKGRTYQFYVRLVGKTQDMRTPWMQTTLATPAGTYPGAVTELVAAGREGSVQLSWEGQAKAYDVYSGSDPFKLQKLARVTRPAHRAAGLTNGQATWFAVAGLDAQGQPGVLSRPIVSAAQDCTPPASPSKVVPSLTGNVLEVNWTPAPPDPDLETYRVYAVPAGRPYGIPIRVDKESSQASLGAIASGRYDIFVTARDGSGNESIPTGRVSLTVP